MLICLILAPSPCNPKGMCWSVAVVSLAQGEPTSTMVSPEFLHSFIVHSKSSFAKHISDHREGALKASSPSSHKGGPALGLPEVLGLWPFPGLNYKTRPKNTYFSKALPNTCATFFWERLATKSPQVSCKNSRSRGWRCVQNETPSDKSPDGSVALTPQRNFPSSTQCGSRRAKSFVTGIR